MDAKFALAIERTLQSFEYVGDWTDLTSFLSRLLQTLLAYKECDRLPLAPQVAKRLAQCLNPALPSGVHQKALDVYDQVLGMISPEALAKDLALYTFGLFPFLRHAATLVRPRLLGIYERHFLPLKYRLKPCLRGLIIALLPGLEEEESEHFDRVMDLLLHIAEAVENPFFYASLFLVTVSYSELRLAALHFLSRQLPAVVTKEDIACVLGGDVGPLARALAVCLDDRQLLVQRGALELLVSQFPPHAGTFQQEDLVRVMSAAVGVTLKRDMSLNRRLYSWLLGNEQAGNEYFQKHCQAALQQSLVQMLYCSEDDLALIQQPFKILISLLDKSEIGNPMVEAMFVKVLAACEQRYTTTKHRDELFLSAGMFLRLLDPALVWRQLEELLRLSASSEASWPEKTQGLMRLEFFLQHLKLEDEQSAQHYLPSLLAHLFASLVAKTGLFSFPDYISKALQLCQAYLDTVSLKKEAKDWQPMFVFQHCDAISPPASKRASYYVWLGYCSACLWHQLLFLSADNKAILEQLPPASIKAIHAFTRHLWTLDSSLLGPSEQKRIHNYRIQLFGALNGYFIQRTDAGLVFDVFYSALDTLALLGKDKACTSRLQQKELVVGFCVEQLWLFMDPSYSQNHHLVVQLVWKAAIQLDAKQQLEQQLLQLVYRGSTELSWTKLATFWLETQVLYETQPQPDDYLLETLPVALVSAWSRSGPESALAGWLDTCLSSAGVSFLLRPMLGQLEAQARALVQGLALTQDLVPSADLRRIRTVWQSLARVLAAKREVAEGLLHTCLDPGTQQPLEQSLAILGAIFTRWLCFCALTEDPANEPALLCLESCLGFLRLFTGPYLLRNPDQTKAALDPVLVCLDQSVRHDLASQAKLLSILSSCLAGSHVADYLLASSTFTLLWTRFPLSGAAAEPWLDVTRTLIPLLWDKRVHLLVQLAQNLQLALSSTPTLAHLQSCIATAFILLDFYLQTYPKASPLTTDAVIALLLDSGALQDTLFADNVQEKKPKELAGVLQMHCLVLLTKLVQARTNPSLNARESRLMRSVLMDRFSQCHQTKPGVFLEHLAWLWWVSDFDSGDGGVVAAGILELVAALYQPLDVLSLALVAMQADKPQTQTRVFAQFSDVFTRHHVGTDQLLSVLPMAHHRLQELAKRSGSGGVDSPWLLYLILGLYEKLESSSRGSVVSVGPHIQEALDHLCEKTFVQIAAWKPKPEAAWQSRERQREAFGMPYSRILFRIVSVLFTVFSFEDASTVSRGVLGALLKHLVEPFIRQHNTLQQSLALAVLKELADVGVPVDLWAGAVWAAFVEEGSGVWATSVANFLQWMALIQRITAHDKKKVTEFVDSMVTAPPALFANKAHEERLRAGTVRRLSWLLFSGTRDQHLRALPRILERLVELHKLPFSPLLQHELYLCLRLVVARFSEPHLQVFWPLVITELIHALSKLLAQPAAELCNAAGASAWIPACKLLDLLLYLQMDGFLAHQWVFVNDTLAEHSDALVGKISLHLRDAFPGVSNGDVVAYHNKPLLSTMEIQSPADLCLFFHKLGTYYTQVEDSKPDRAAVDDALAVDLIRPLSQ